MDWLEQNIDAYRIIAEILDELRETLRRRLNQYTAKSGIRPACRTGCLTVWCAEGGGKGHRLVRERVPTDHELRPVPRSARNPRAQRRVIPSDHGAGPHRGAPQRPLFRARGHACQTGAGPAHQRDRAVVPRDLSPEVPEGHRRPPRSNRAEVEATPTAAPQTTPPARTATGTGAGQAHPATGRTGDAPGSPARATGSARSGTRREPNRDRRRRTHGGASADRRGEHASSGRGSIRGAA